MAPYCYDWSAHRPLKQPIVHVKVNCPIKWSVSDFYYILSPEDSQDTLGCPKTGLTNYTLSSQMCSV